MGFARCYGEACNTCFSVEIERYIYHFMQIAFAIQDTSACLTSSVSGLNMSSQVLNRSGPCRPVERGVDTWPLAIAGKHKPLQKRLHIYNGAYGIYTAKQETTNFAVLVGPALRLSGRLWQRLKLTS